MNEAAFTDSYGNIVQVSTTFEGLSFSEGEPIPDELDLDIVTNGLVTISATDLDKKRIGVIVRYSEKPDFFILYDPQNEEYKLLPYFIDESEQTVRVSTDSNSTSLKFFLAQYMSAQKEKSQVKVSAKLNDRHKVVEIVDRGESSFALKFYKFTDPQEYSIYLEHVDSNWENSGGERLLNLLNGEIVVAKDRINDDENGLYTNYYLTVKKKFFFGADKPGSVWEQRVYAPNVVDLPGAETAANLAEKYLPILKFHPDEKYYPMSLEEILSIRSGSAFLDVSNVGLDPNFRVLMGETLKDFLKTNGHQDNFFNFDVSGTTCDISNEEKPCSP